MEENKLFLQDVGGSLKIKYSNHDDLLSTIYERIFLLQGAPPKGRLIQDYQLINHST
jgi:hypothetical protein